VVETFARRFGVDDRCVWCDRGGAAVIDATNAPALIRLVQIVDDDGTRSARLMRKKLMT
jgi:hypothetical protein